jgi:hypothetical protein
VIEFQLHTECPSISSDTLVVRTGSLGDSGGEADCVAATRAGDATEEGDADGAVEPTTSIDEEDDAVTVDDDVALLLLLLFGSLTRTSAGVMEIVPSDPRSDEMSFDCIGRWFEA